MAISAESLETVKDITFPDEQYSTNITSYGVDIPSKTLTTVLNENREDCSCIVPNCLTLKIWFVEDADRVVVSLISLKNIQDYMPPETTDSDNPEESVQALRYDC